MKSFFEEQETELATLRAEVETSMREQKVRREAILPAPGEMKQAMADDDRAQAAADYVAGVEPPSEIRKRALLTLRCSDCKGMPIAYVTILHGRAAVWCRPRKGNGDWTARYLEGVHYGYDAAWCRFKEWVVDPSELLSELPARGNSKAKVIRESH